MQIHRQLTTVYLLMAKGRVTAKELAARFGVAERTIYRDLDALSAVGIPVYTSKGHGGGISLLPEYRLNGSVLTDAEKTEILSALSALAEVRLDAHTAALAKLSAVFANVAADWVEVDFSAWSGSAAERDKFEALKAAILEKRKVTFTYFSAAKEGGETRTVCPLKLCFRGQSWYLYGFCESRNENRFFKLRRMENLNVSEVGHRLAAPARVMESGATASEPLRKAVLAISGKMAYRVYDEFGEVERNEKGDLIVTVCYSRPEWLFSLLTTYGRDCRILEPPDLRREMRNFLSEILENYR